MSDMVSEILKMDKDITNVSYRWAKVSARGGVLKEYIKAFEKAAKVSKSYFMAQVDILQIDGAVNDIKVRGFNPTATVSFALEDDNFDVSIGITFPSPTIEGDDDILQVNSPVIKGITIDKMVREILKQKKAFISKYSKEVNESMNEAALVKTQVYVNKKGKGDYEDYVIISDIDGDNVTFYNPFDDEKTMTVAEFKKKYKKGSQSDYDVFEEVDGVQFVSILGSRYPILTEGADSVVCVDAEGNKFKVDKCKLNEGVYSDIDIEIQEILSLDHGVKGLSLELDKISGFIRWFYKVDGEKYQLGTQKVGDFDKFCYINGKPVNVKTDKKGVQNLLKRYVGSMITWLKNQSKKGPMFSAFGVQSSPIMCLYILDHLGPEVGKPIDKDLVESIVEVVNGKNVIPTAREIVTRNYKKQIKYLEDKYKVKF